MSKDKISQEPKLEELSSDDLDQVQGGKAAGIIGGKKKGLTGEEVGFPSSISPTPKNMERVHEDE